MLKFYLLDSEDEAADDAEEAAELGKGLSFRASASNVSSFFSSSVFYRFHKNKETSALLSSLFFLSSHTSTCLL